MPGSPGTTWVAPWHHAFGVPAGRACRARDHSPWLVLHGQVSISFETIDSFFVELSLVFPLCTCPASTRPRRLPAAFKGPEPAPNTDVGQHESPRYACTHHTKRAERPGKRYIHINTTQTHQSRDQVLRTDTLATHSDDGMRPACMPGMVEVHSCGPHLAPRHPPFLVRPPCMHPFLVTPC